MPNKFFNTIKGLYCDWLERRYLKLPSELDSLTYVEESDDFGRGVYAATAINKGTLLGIYPGHKRRRPEFVAKEEFINRSMRYAYAFQDGTVIDPTDLFGFMPNKSHLRLALVNEPPLGVAVNVLPVPSRNHVWYLALKDITKDEQLFTNYGPKYRRDYPSEMAVTDGHVKLFEEDKDLLRHLQRDYPWLEIEPFCDANRDGVITKE